MAARRASAASTPPRAAWGLPPALAASFERLVVAESIWCGCHGE